MMPVSLEKEALQSSVNLELCLLEQCPLPLSVPVAFEFIRYDGLYAVISMICREKIANRLREQNLHESLVPALNLICRQPSRNYETLPSEIRMEVMRTAFWLLSDWPKRFVDTFQKNGMLSSGILGTGMDLPYWLDNVIRKELYRPKYRVSQEEIVSATRVVSQSTTKLHKVDIERVLGIHDSTTLEEQYRYEPLDMGNVMKLIAGLDFDMSNASPARGVQASIIRDGIAIICMIAFQIGVSDVCALDRESAQRMWQQFGKTVVGSTMFNARNILIKQLVETGDRWLSVYLEVIRPRFIVSQGDCDLLLLTRFGQPYFGHGLHDRFIQLLRKIGYSHPQRGFRVLSDLGGIGWQSAVALNGK